jgi:N-acetylated-alpha-linked acidic dipeptidase
MRLTALLLAGAALLSAPMPASAAAGADPAREAAFDAHISAGDQLAWLKDMASAPNHVGSPHDKANAEATLALFRAWGWDAHIETFQILYPTPVSTTLEMIAPARTRLGGQEPAVAADPDSAKLAGALPPYVAYQGDGDVTAPLVYVNYGMPADYEALARRGIDVKGKIVIARYGGGWRGLKPKLAQDHGAVGCLIYSDPADDGYARFDPYPAGGGRPSFGVQRGSVMDMTLYPGDPLTPDVAATPDARRLSRAEAATILKIPALPISYADATKLMEHLEGPVATDEARGALPFAYHYGGTSAVVAHLAVRSNWALTPIYDVIATLKGSSRPDEWIIRANHRDAWVFGAADPLSGHVAMLSEAKALGALAKSGWKPARTIVYASWDGEEPSLLGSTEWVEAHADELRAKALLYLNTDNNGRGFLAVDGSQDLQHFVTDAAADVTDPETGASLVQRQRADVAAKAYLRPGSQKAEDMAALKAGTELPIGPLGSGSDYSAFLQHLGIPALDLRFRGEDATSASYHSAYDSFHHYTTFDDPGLAYGVALSKLTGRLVMRAADAPRLPARYVDFAAAVARYVGEVKALAAKGREKDAALAAAIAAGDFRLASDPADPTTAPPSQAAAPAIDFGALEAAATRLKASAAAADMMLAGFDGLSPAKQAKVEAPLRSIDQALIDPAGLPFRPWYRNMVYAPGRFTGYGAKTLPGVREAIEERRFADAVAYVTRTAAVLNSYADRLDAAVAAGQ